MRKIQKLISGENHRAAGPVVVQSKHSAKNSRTASLQEENSRLVIKAWFLVLGLNVISETYNGLIIHPERCKNKEPEPFCSITLQAFLTFMLCKICWIPCFHLSFVCRIAVAESLLLVALSARVLSKRVCCDFTPALAEIC
jgi:hypothetical protein